MPGGGGGGRGRGGRRRAERPRRGRQQDRVGGDGARRGVVEVGAASPRERALDVDEKTERHVAQPQAVHLPRQRRRRRRRRRRRWSRPLTWRGVDRPRQPGGKYECKPITHVVRSTGWALLQLQKHGSWYDLE